MLANGNPVIDNPTAAQWFDTSVFERQPAFTPRTNPWQYSGLTGPASWDLQGSVSKNFVITERVRTEFKVAGYNLANVLIRANPDLGVTSSNFGKVLRQRGGYSGRQLEYGLKFIF